MKLKTLKEMIRMITNLNYIPFDQNNAMCGENLIKKAVLKGFNERIEDLVNFVKPTFNHMSKTNDELNVIKNDETGFTLEYMKWIFDFHFDGKWTWKPRYWHDSKFKK